MKIAFYSGEMGRMHASRIIKLLQDHAPSHHYNHCADEMDADLWHCLSPHNSLYFIRRASRSVVSLPDLRFITEPQLFSLSDRLFRLPLYRYHCCHAARLITSSARIKRRVVGLLGVDDRTVEVCMPLLAAHIPYLEYTPTAEEQLVTRQRLELPESYILVEGVADTMHDHGVILHAILSMPQSLSVVVHTRRTTHSDTLLQMVRDVGAAERVQFIYEVEPKSLLALYRMALFMIYMPAFESSVEPVIKALHQGVAMILSDTPLNREAAGSAAKYVPSHDEHALGAAIKLMLYNESVRGQLIAQCWAEARRYSEERLAEQLAQIYESV